MKRTMPLVGGVVGCLSLVVGAYLGATTIMGSTFACRSPQPLPGVSIQRIDDSKE